MQKYAIGKFKQKPQLKIIQKKIIDFSYNSDPKKTFVGTVVNRT